MKGLSAVHPLFWVLMATCLAGGCTQKEKPAPAGMVLIPAGSFIMGSNRVDTTGQTSEFGMAKPLFLDEHPEREVYLPAFFMDRFEMTIRQYEQFVQATGSTAPMNWPGGTAPPGRGLYPVSDVNWYDAGRACRWMGKRLPTEAEWEKTARGSGGLEYPWGNEYDPQKANTGSDDRGDLAPVGSYESGKSPYGVHDLAGNVWEWTQDWYQPYPSNDYQSDRFGQKYKVMRGSSWGGVGHYALAVFYRAAHRFYSEPENGFPDAGFRCAKDVGG